MITFETDVTKQERDSGLSQDKTRLRVMRYYTDEFGAPLNEEWEDGHRQDMIYTGKLMDREDGSQTFTYFGRRHYDSRNGVWMSEDPAILEDGDVYLSSDPRHSNAYLFNYNNPLRYVDPDGRLVETGWDLFNVGMGIASLGTNLYIGNFSGAALDLAGIGADMAATAVPGIPGGAGSAIKATRIGKSLDRGMDVVNTISNGTSFKGKKGFELKNARYQKTRNKSTLIEDRLFSGHALDQMQNRGVMPSVVKSAIKTGVNFPTKPGTKGVYDAVNKIRVITNSQTGQVVTVIRGAPH